MIKKFLLFQNLKQLSKRVKKRIFFYKDILRDSRTPWYAKAILGLAISYLVFPIDLIPDFVPVLGQLDDVIIVPVLFTIGLKLVPKRIIKEYEVKYSEEA